MTLNTPLLWVLFPLVIAAIVGALYQRKALSIILTVITAFGLALLAALFPENLTLSIGPLRLVFSENLAILGRQITVKYEILPFISLIYAMTGLWTLSSWFPNTPVAFRPISLVLTALLTAAAGVEPFLYAAVLIQIAILVSVPMLSQGGGATDRGILRYLTLQTLAMPLILLAGWLLTGVETLPADSPLVGQSTILLGLGFALWLGIFPFHSWIPMVTQRSRPNVVGFLVFLFPTTILVFSLNFFNRYTFLRNLPNLAETLQLFGVVMIVIGGLWTAFQTDLKRAFGFSVLTESGFSLAALGLISQGGLNWLMLLFPLRALGFWLWSFALTALENHAEELTFESVRGIARQFPILSAGLILAQFSIAGMPLLASFPIKLALLSATLNAGTAFGLWSFIGNLGLFLFTLRLLFSLLTPQDENTFEKWRLSEKSNEYLPVLIMILILVLLGLFPNNFMDGILNTLTAFTQLQ